MRCQLQSEKPVGNNKEDEQMLSLEAVIFLLKVVGRSLAHNRLIIIITMNRHCKGPIRSM